MLVARVELRFVTTVLIEVIAVVLLLIDVAIVALRSVTTLLILVIALVLLAILVAIVALNVAISALVATLSPSLNKFVAFALTANKLVAFKELTDVSLKLNVPAVKLVILAVVALNILVSTVVAVTVFVVILVPTVRLLNVTSVALTAFILVVPAITTSPPIDVLFSTVSAEPERVPPTNALAEIVVATLTLITLP